MKRKALSSAAHSRLSKVVRLADFGRVAQSKIAEAILRRANPKAVGDLLEDLGVTSKKIAVLFGKFSQMADPSPPFGNFNHILPIFLSSWKFLGDSKVC